MTIAFLLLVFLQDKDPVSVTDHEIKLNGETIVYTATAGTTTLTDDKGKATAKMFYVAYAKKDSAKRPLTFSFNGGPGSSSVWLHLGLLGPRRVDMKDDPFPSKPPFPLVDNVYSLLDKTDLVFIDPVSTGYSRAAEGVESKAFHGVEEDIESVGKFIHGYVSRHGRWSSPRFLIGESYGTLRAAALSAHLQEVYGMELCGVMLISCVLNFDTIHGGTDLSLVLALPTYAATAWYHKKLSPEFKDLKKLLAEVEEFASTEYALALFKDAELSDADRKRVTGKLSRYTGLSEAFITRCNLRVSLGRFNKELRREDRCTVGRLDSRYTGRDADAAGENNTYDPSYAAIQGPYTECVYSYLRSELQYESDQVYEILTGKVRPWNYGPAGTNKAVDVSGRLRQAMNRNPHLKVFVACGAYDQATPYFATRWTFNHLGVEPALRKNITLTQYEAGHMMYIHGPSLKQLRDDLATFVDSALGAR